MNSFMASTIATQAPAWTGGAQQLLDRGGALGESIERARRYAGAARDALAQRPDGAIKAALAEIADFVVERAY